MARRSKSDAGEHFTVKRTMRLTPSQAAELDTGADKEGVSWSDFARNLVFRRSAARPSGIGRAEIVTIRRELESSQHANNSVGNLLNQLARHANTTGELGPQRLAELDEAIDLTKRATELYIAALLHAIAL